MHETFNNEIQKCVKDNSFTFEFPIYIKDQINELAMTVKVNSSHKKKISGFFNKDNHNHQEIPEGIIKCSDSTFNTFYDGKVNQFTWYKIIVSTCIWKGIECYSLQFVPNTDLKLKQFINNYVHKINTEMSKVLNSLEIICNTCPDPVKQALVGASPFRSPNLLRRTVNNDIAQRQAVRHLAEITGRIPMAEQRNEDCFDNSLLLNTKYSLNYVYDLYLTISAFKMLKSGLKNKKVSDFHFKYFLNYIVNYFYMPCRIRNWKIELNNELDKEVIASYEYLRTLIFNLLFFIVNNSRDEGDKVVEISIKHDKFTVNDAGSFYKLTFKFVDHMPRINYHTDLVQLFTILKKTPIHKLDPKIFEIFDLGIITSFYIAQEIDEDIKITKLSDDSKVMISTLFFANLKERGGFNEEKDNKVFTKKSNFEIEEKYYKQILMKLYKFDIHKYKEKIGKESCKFSHTFTDQISDTEDNEDEEDQTLLEDKLKNEEIKSKFVDREYIFDYLLKSSLTKQEIKEMSSKLKFEDSDSTKSSKARIQTWDNIKIMKNMKYCSVPRFLIVEDNVAGRKNIRETLRKLDFKFMIDNVGDGKDAVEKFKKLFIQGYLFDFIFMDINLPEMFGSEATKIIRDMEGAYSNIRTNIIAVTVEGQFEMDNYLFDEYCKMMF